MIKKIIGTLFAIATVAVMIATIIGSGSYTSMLPDDFVSTLSIPQPAVEAPAEPTTDAPAEIPAEPTADEAHTEMQAESTDSLTIE